MFVMLIIITIAGFAVFVRIFASLLRFLVHLIEWMFRMVVIHGKSKKVFEKRRAVVRLDGYDYRN